MKISEEMELTPEEIKTMDEIFFDKQAAEKTLEIALQFHSNLCNKNSKQYKKFWNDLLKCRQLNNDTSWIIDTKHRCPFLREKKEDDN